jgi:oligopeptide/dipeptide ABC transporter ATP-binding protein
VSALFRMADVVKHFRTPEGMVHAVDGVSLEIAPGEVLGLVGESGCGKSSLARLAMRITTPESGTIELDGTDITQLGRSELRPHRAKMQMIFQDPFASLNPRSTVARIIEEPLIVHRRGNAAERRDRVRWLMAKVGLPVEAENRLPHEFSGGQRQRIGIARALALSPKLIICDEPVSALDVSIRAQVINLLARLRAELGISYLFISHDLSVVEHIADRIAVMYLGKIVEIADRRTLWRKPLHPYTQALLAAVPAPAIGAARRKIPMRDVAPPSPLAPPSGCRFHTRCLYAEERCRVTEPALLPIDGAPRAVACHLVDRHGRSSVPSPADAMSVNGNPE